MAWVKKTAVVSGIVIGVAACFTSMLPTSSRTEAAIAVFDEKNIEEAIKTAIQTANILTEEQKQLALMILNMKQLDVGMLEELMKRNEEKNKAALAGDLIYPDGMLNGNASIQQIWTERMGDIEDVLNGNATVYDIVIQEQRRQKAIHQASKETALAAQQTIKMDKQNMEDARKALEASNKAEGQQQVLQAGNYLLYDILQSVSAGNRAKAHMAASMATYYDSKIQEQAESERILTNSKNISKKWVENSK